MNDKDLLACTTDLVENLNTTVEVTDSNILSAIASTIEAKITEYVEEEYITSAQDEAAVVSSVFTTLQ
jgi:hypothetical protein